MKLSKSSIVVILVCLAVSCAGTAFVLFIAGETTSNCAQLQTVKEDIRSSLRLQIKQVMTPGTVYYRLYRTPVNRKEALHSLQQRMALFSKGGCQ